MKRSKLIISAILLVFLTMTGTVGGMLYLMGLDTGDFGAVLRLQRTMKMLRTQYVEPVQSEMLVQGAIQGMVKSLGDPHSLYMDEKMYKEFLLETNGSFGGIGVVIGVKDKMLTVVAPIEGTPGEKAGIKSGDQVLRIDGKDTKDMALDEAVGKIRGDEGTKVVLTVRRGDEEPKEYTLIRAKIEIKTVAGKMLPGDLGYIRISMFNEHTGADFDAKFRELEQAGMKGLVLDLRDNPGGLLDQSVKVAGKMVPKGPIVSVVTRDGQREVHSSTLQDAKYSVAVLVNGGSASASEIVAGALQDTGVGVLVGSKTYGKGSVQTIKPMLINGGAVKLTIAKYLTPKDRSINGVGIEPDIPVEGGKEAGQNDLVLEKAIDVLKMKLAQGASAVQ